MIKKYLLAPGPTPVPESVLLAMAQPIIHHRTPQFEALFADTSKSLQALFKTSQDVLMLASSGTGAMEAAVTNTTSPGDRVLVVNGGKFGERWAKIAATYGLAVTELKVEWGTAVDPAAIARALKEHPETRLVLMQAQRDLDHRRSIRSPRSPRSRASATRCSSSTASRRSACSTCRWTDSASTSWSPARRRR